MIARLIAAPAIVLGFAYWINQVHVQYSGESLVPEIVAVGGGYAQPVPATTSAIQMAQGQKMFW